MDKKKIAELAAYQKKLTRLRQKKRALEKLINTKTTEKIRVEQEILELEAKVSKL